MLIWIKTTVEWLHSNSWTWPRSMLIYIPLFVSFSWLALSLFSPSSCEAFNVISTYCHTLFQFSIIFLNQKTNKQETKTTTTKQTTPQKIHQKKPPNQKSQPPKVVHYSVSTSQQKAKCTGTWDYSFFPFLHLQWGKMTDQLKRTKLIEGLKVNGDSKELHAQRRESRSNTVIWISHSFSPELSDWGKAAGCLISIRTQGDLRNSKGNVLSLSDSAQSLDRLQSLRKIRQTHSSGFKRSLESRVFSSAS